MMTQPFNFESRLRPPPTGWDFVPFVDIGVILLFFSLMSSRFVLAPGLEFELPTTKTVPAARETAAEELTVSEIEGRESLLFEGRQLTVEALGQLLQARAGEFQGKVLLLRIDRDVSFALGTRVFDLLQNAGFERVVMAAEREPAPAAEPRAP